MENGISLYPGLDNTREENLDLLSAAAACGIRRVFTSLHIPETDTAALKRELAEILAAARQYGMEIISDISPKTLAILDMPAFDLSAFRQLGITTLRLDYGYEAAQIAELSHNDQGIRLQLNASTVTERILSELQAAGTDFSHIDALHNFYPRRGTGLSESILRRKTTMLQQLGIKVGAFVPSQGRKRGPLFEGLPTLEAHRLWHTDRAARHLAAIGIDSIFLSDSLPIKSELTTLGGLQGDEVVLEAQLLTADPVQQALLGHHFTAREDEARDAVRAQESRGLLTSSVKAENNKERRRGAITIDNRDYQRYMGELEIVKRSQPADKRVNVVGRVSECELFLLKYITPGRKFSFRFEE
ncbi:MAG: MupG family TIM beta-alpha barrel fold protein [Selenomonas sp.]|uniref:DUF871 domain-containing protein n=1 Tax=Selenomonas sp. TaxID=2053611 RepID=UPI0025DC9483|nr:MupG family TIM beta-alpha barrel fold protein [Selenomonas sp.]MCR5757158.1 MupG family TIM beta-alpha barrel fold protein [Selenomonas sp.]